MRWAAEVFPSDDGTTVAISVMVGLIGLGFLVAACAAMYVMGGWRATPFGAIFVAGFGVLAYGLAEAGNAWRDVGVVLLMISCASFWVAGVVLPACQGEAAQTPSGHNAEVSLAAACSSSVR